MPIDLNQFAPRSMMCGTQQRVSTLLTTVGLRNAPSIAGNGGLIRGQPRFPSRLSISPVSSPQIYAPAPRCSQTSRLKPRAVDVLAQVPGRARLGDRRLEDLVGLDVLEPKIDVGRGGLGGEAGDQDPLEELVRVLLHEQPVVERRRLALVGVDAHERFLPILGKEVHFSPHGKPAPPRPRSSESLTMRRPPSPGRSPAPCATPGSRPRDSYTLSVWLSGDVPVAAQDGFKRGHGRDSRSIR